VLHTGRFANNVMPNFGVQIMIEVAQAPPVSVRQNTFAMRAQRQQANRALVRIANASS
jgi:hypothetical protein